MQGAPTTAQIPTHLHHIQHRLHRAQPQRRDPFLLPLLLSLGLRRRLLEGRDVVEAGGVARGLVVGAGEAEEGCTCNMG